MPKKLIEKMTQTLNWNFIAKHKVVVDCGHLPIHHGGDGFHFGANGDGPSATQIITLDLGLFLYSELKKQQKDPLLSICLTDTTKYVGDPKVREQIMEHILGKEYDQILPHEYIEKIEKADINRDDIHITLQTKNSNKFSNVIKKTKNTIRKFNGKHEEIAEAMNAIFLEDHDEITFGFTNQFLLDRTKEHAIFSGDWWLDETVELQKEEILMAPAARLKKLGIIKLFSKANGIHCPATYGGLLLNFDNTVHDHIAIYARSDDEFIGDKIMRGIIATSMLSENFESRCIEITIPHQADDLEISYLSKNLMQEHRSGNLFKLYEDSSLHKNYKLYA